jgi:hypothetical protein
MAPMAERSPEAFAGDTPSHRDVGVRTQPERGGSPEPGLRVGLATRCVHPVRPDVSRGCCSPATPV